MEYELSSISGNDLPEIYQWKVSDNMLYYYTCRTLKDISDYNEFKTNIEKWINTEGNIYYIFRDKFNKTIIGEVKGFDYNSRNQSMEFGYYLPQENRKHGHGTILVKCFVDHVFSNMAVNKLYATTAACNDASKRILEKNGFTLDGKNREHYWIDNQKYDQFVYSLLRSEWEIK